MKSFFIAAVLTLFALVFTGYSSNADAAKRLGGGKSSGMQRDSVKKDAAPPTAAPATPANTATAAPAAAAAPKAPAPAGNKWLGPLAGLAAGGLLAAMFMGGGFDGLKMFDILLMVGLAVGMFMLFRWYMRKQAGSAPAGLQYAGAGGSAPTEVPQAMQRESVAADGRIMAPEIGSRLASGNASAAEIDSATRSPRIPADFDVAPFEREARAAFIRLQAANDRKDLNDIRDFTTPEMYAEISLQLLERGDAPQQTEVLSLTANVLEVITENNRAVASVRFVGTMREDLGATPEAFDEVWHVVKDLANKRSTWQLAGIQQLT